MARNKPNLFMLAMNTGTSRQSGHNLCFTPAHPCANLPSREGSCVPEYLRPHMAPTFEPVTPGGNPRPPRTSICRGVAALVAALASPPQFKTPVRQCEHAGPIDLHKRGHKYCQDLIHPVYSASLSIVHCPLYLDLTTLDARPATL